MGTPGDMPPVPPPVVAAVDDPGGPSGAAPTPTSPTVGRSDFDILGALGCGGSSEVLLVRHQQKVGSLHAMKVIAKH